MPAQFNALVMAMAAISLAALLVPRELFWRQRHVFSAWACAGFCFFLFGDPAFVLVSSIIVILAFSPRGAVPKTAFYVGIAAFLPFSLEWLVPFPGINFLFAATPQKLAAMFVLIPALATGFDSKRAGSPAAILIVLFCFYAIIAVLRGANVTVSLRYGFDQFLVYALPYLALLCVLKDEKDVDACVDAFIVATVILAFITLFSAARQWNFYSYNIFMDARSGLLRIAGTASNHTLGMHLVAGVLLIQSARERLMIGRIRLSLLRVMLFAALLFTGSRGAFVGLAVGGIIYIAFSARHAVARHFVLWFTIGCMLVASVWLVSADVSKVDEYGTFVYRQELLRTSLEYWREHLWLGDVYYLRSGRFEHLIQGQQIIDITNYYLQIGLGFGVVGCVMVFSMYAHAGFGLWRFVSLRETPPGARATAVAVLSTLAGWMLLVATTSDYGITVHLGTTFAALGAACLANGRQIARVLLTRVNAAPAGAPPRVIVSLAKPCS